LRWLGAASFLLRTLPSPQLKMSWYGHGRVPQRGSSRRYVCRRALVLDQRHTYLSHTGNPRKSARSLSCETCDFCTDRRGRYRQSIRKATGAADSRSDEEAQAIGGRLPVKNQLIAAAKADIEQHIAAPVEVSDAPRSISRGLSERKNGMNMGESPMSFFQDNCSGTKRIAVAPRCRFRECSPHIGDSSPASEGKTGVPCREILRSSTLLRHHGSSLESEAPRHPLDMTGHCSPLGTC